MSSERLARIGVAVNAEIARGQLPGAVLAIARHGKLVYLETCGLRDKAAGVRMSADTIFSIASMTKPMTAVGALQLYEQGKLLMDEPAATYFPALATMQVAVMDASKEKVVGQGRTFAPLELLWCADLLPDANPGTAVIAQGAVMEGNDRVVDGAGRSSAGR